MITVTGNTFEHRERFKRLNGQWNADARAWQFFRLTPEQIAELRSLPGCAVSGNERQPKPASDDDGLSAIIAAILSDGNGKGEEPITANRSTAIYGDDQRYLNYFKDKNPYAFFGFSSLAAMIDYIKAAPATGPGWENDDDDWSGTATMPQALALARNGWQEGYQNAAEIVDALAVAHAVKRRRQLGVTGGHVSVGRMLSGNPVHMVKRAKLPGRRIVTLFVEATASAAIEAENIIARAAIVAAICDTMEREGYSLEIVSLVTVRNDRTPAAQTAVTIKHAGEKFNLQDIVFALGNPAFLRRFHFACVTSSPECRLIYDTQGKPSEAFNDKYPTAKNEFYIRHLTMREQAAIGSDSDMRERALRMLPFVEPANLPIKILSDK
jgi:hypothetical protein